ncbi:hypothetical protein AKJ36_00505 [candidate division MSBL1 archaeon SCGC-AAA259I07]|uniref:YbaK/aminoacyl-tRNA synthetase-associated domain-containing protein n=1 Tax=candidate division MSBL1 archaeon SCGC-AAA259I07 TaxID=1698266 RepID=A0A133UMP2_9EURY|nr:hypothetical protein AKJ36_00505 [candidate division MSBL1 archaeon SCGC-AAA259I07]
MKNFLDEADIEADFYEFSEPTLSVEDASRQLGVNPEKIIKSLVFKDEDDSPVLAIVAGDKRVDEDKLSKVHGSRVKMAKARDVEEFSGYKIGEVPPVSHGLKTIIDTEIMDFDSIIAGGGSTHTLVELDPRDIARITDAKLAKIS